MDGGKGKKKTKCPAQSDNKAPPLPYDSENTGNKPRRMTQIKRDIKHQNQLNETNPERRKAVERGGVVKVNKPRPRLVNHLHYVGFPERLHWLRGPAGAENLVRLVHSADGRGSLIGSFKIGPGILHPPSYSPSLPMPRQPIVALVPNVGSLGKHRIVVAAEPLSAWDSSLAPR